VQFATMNTVSTGFEAGAKPLPKNTLFLAAVPVGILLNLGIGTLVHLLKLPLFLDAVGTVLVTVLVRIPAGITTRVLSFLLGGLLLNPVMPYFCGTQAAIALFVGLMARQGLFTSMPKTILTGIMLGVVAAVVSAPVIVHLFGGITGSGSGVITAFLLASGQSVLKSVVLTGVSCEPVDKTLQCLLALWLLRSLPRRLKRRFGNQGYLQRNFPA
jgi:energy-coupling factor transport system substrate-specific component